MRCAHDSATEILTGPYTEDEFWDDLLRVTGGHTDEQLARFMIRESKEILTWIVEQGVRWQPSLGGTLSLGRTNSFFLGGGRSMLNALYLTAERLGVEVEYDAEAVDLDIADGTFRSVTVARGPERATVRASALVAAAGGFEANIEWLKEYWGPPADNFLIRGTPYNRGTVLKMLLDKGVEPVGDPTQCHAVAIDARAPKFDGGIITRLDCVVFGIVVNKHAQRFYDEGEDIWPKRYAIWGRLVAAQPDQIGYIIFDAKSLTLFMPSLYPPVQAGSIRELAHKLDLDPDALDATVNGFNAAVRPGTFDDTTLDDCRTEGLDPPKSHWARRDRHRAVLRLPGPARHHLHLSRHAREPRGPHADAGRRGGAKHVRGRRDHGRQRARPRLRRRHRHDDRQRLRARRRTGGRRTCPALV